MRFTALSVLALATLAITSGAEAQVKPFGAGFDGWGFTATIERPGMVNCRATRRVAGRDDIISMRTGGATYLSVKADGRKGKWPGSIVYIPGKPRGSAQWTLTAEANGTRLWVPVDAAAIDVISVAGTYEISLNDTEDTLRVPLGRNAAKAWARVNECMHAHGG